MKNECNCELCKLRSLFFFHASTDVIKLMCENKTEHQYDKGEIIIYEGSEIKDFIYLKSGLVKLSRKGTDGKDQIISFAKPFDFVSLLSVFSSSTYNYTVTALDETIICAIVLEKIKAVALINGEFTMGLMTRVSEATDKIILNNLEIRRKNLKGRIAHVILYFAHYIYNNNKFELPISRREIAEYIGMTTENVIRTLSEFRKDHILKFDGKQIEIENEKLLKSISEHG
ncbi:MAG: Crp/Fnr family transcriptional regulator [Bacteroidetes bacterium]|nr:Crp/Fnr family transcriptional regulator [Bacteroidota bacterium]